VSADAHADIVYGLERNLSRWSRFLATWAGEAPTGASPAHNRNHWGMSEPSLHPLVKGFADAELYDRGRPAYGEETTSLLMSGLELAADDPVLELGAGTGQLSCALLDAGLDLTAVEPLGPTRELLVRAIGAERVRDGVAEQIPLADDSVHAIFAADSFHWFDEQRAMPEIRRVLRPRGGVAILRSFPVWEASWSAEFGKLLEVDRSHHPVYTDRPADAALQQDKAFGEVTETVVHSERTIDREGVLAYLATVSWIATLPDERREQLLAGAAEILERNGVDELPHRVRHLIWYARLRA
jgi:SAM-dependent methyltransferase